MKIIELDLTGCEYQYDMHEKINQKWYSLLLDGWFFQTDIFN